MERRKYARACAGNVIDVWAGGYSDVMRSESYVHMGEVAGCGWNLLR